MDAVMDGARDRAREAGTRNDRKGEKHAWDARILKRVFLISPYAGDVRGLVGSTYRAEEVAKNLDYLRHCILDCFDRNEAPFAPHGLYPQALDDDDIGQRTLGILAGHLWLLAAESVVCYVDRGVSEGMRGDLEKALKTKTPSRFGSPTELLSMPIAFRSLRGVSITDTWLHENGVPHRECGICRASKSAAVER